MQKIIHRSDDRGGADHGWLKARHSFSFASYQDPSKVHFGKLRVLNDDIVAPGMGFPAHPHENMEIVTIPLKGALEHQDSMGHTSVVNPGEIQIMSAGTGVTHSEYNHSKEEPVSLLQIWVFPKIKNIAPRYDQKKFAREERVNKFQTVVSPIKEDKGLWINQDAFFSLCNLEINKTLEYQLHIKGNGIYMFVIEGKVDTAGEILNKRDAVGIWETNNIEIKSTEPSEILIIEVPMN